MFKSIEYRLYFYMTLLIAAIVMSTIFTIKGHYVYMVLSILLVFFLLFKLRRSYNQFNKNIIFLLNALDNGDYSFNFTEQKISRKERELNHMMNRIKEILSKARKEVIENEKFLSVIMERVSTGIIILDENDMILQNNKTVNKLLGLPIFTHINQLSHVDKSFPDLFRSLESSDSKIIKIHNEREEVQLSLRASYILLQGKKLKIITIHNIGSELDYKEMDSWIRLIRVMTHEIMNSIAPVTSLTDTLLSAYRLDEEIDENNEEDPLKQSTVEALQTINITAKGLIGFVNSYRRFTGIPKPQKKSVLLQSLLERAIALESSLFEDKGITINMQLPTEPIKVQLDESQIMQVLLNLIKNAIEAIEEKRGTIKFQLSQEGETIHLDIANNGERISEEVLPNIFVPFFTTKHSGSGIGLSVSRYIMRLHGGTLIHLIKGEWTVFRMTFHIS